MSNVISNEMYNINSNEMSNEMCIVISNVMSHEMSNEKSILNSNVMSNRELPMISSNLPPASVCTILKIKTSYETSETCYRNTRVI